jgi:hypothetical protein
MRDGSALGSLNLTDHPNKLCKLVWIEGSLVIDPSERPIVRDVLFYEIDPGTKSSSWDPKRFV